MLTRIVPSETPNTAATPRTSLGNVSGGVVVTSR